MPRDIRLFLEDMLQAAKQIEAYIAGLDQAAFEANRQAADAVLFNLYIIGEAVRNIPQEVREQHPKIAWKEINAMRNIIAHIYFGIDLDQVWDTVKNDLSPLMVNVAEVLESLGPETPPDQNNTTN